jgi:hypothetical protein
MCDILATSFWHGRGVCNQKVEVVEGADEGAESLPTDFYKDLECFLCAISAHIFNELRLKSLLSRQGAAESLPAYAVADCTNFGAGFQRKPEQPSLYCPVLPYR